jgi:hypothetical protein
VPRVEQPEGGLEVVGGDGDGLAHRAHRVVERDARRPRPGTRRRRPARDVAPGRRARAPGRGRCRARLAPARARRRRPGRRPARVAEQLGQPAVVQRHQRLAQRRPDQVGARPAAPPAAASAASVGSRRRARAPDAAGRPAASGGGAQTVLPDGRKGQRASTPRSPVRTRITSSTGVLQTLPSPMLPVAPTWRRPP